MAQTQTLEQKAQAIIDRTQDATARAALTTAFTTAVETGLFAQMDAARPQGVEHYDVYPGENGGLRVDIVYLDKIPGGGGFSRIESTRVATVEGDLMTAFAGFSRASARKGEDIAPVIEAVRTSKQRLDIGTAYSSAR